MDLGSTSVDGKRKRSESTTQAPSLGMLSVNSSDTNAMVRPKSWSPNESMTSYLEDQLSRGTLCCLLQNYGLCLSVNRNRFVNK